MQTGESQPANYCPPHTAASHGTGTRRKTRHSGAGGGCSRPGARALRGLRRAGGGALRATPCRPEPWEPRFQTCAVHPPAEAQPGASFFSGGADGQKSHGPPRGKGSLVLGKACLTGCQGPRPSKSDSCAPEPRPSRAGLWDAGPGGSPAARPANRPRAALCTAPLSTARV